MGTIRSVARLCIAIVSIAAGITRHEELSPVVNGHDGEWPRLYIDIYKFSSTRLSDGEQVEGWVQLGEHAMRNCPQW